MSPPLASCHDRGIPFFGKNVFSERRGSLTQNRFFFAFLLVEYLGHESIDRVAFRFFFSTIELLKWLRAKTMTSDRKKKDAFYDRGAHHFLFSNTTPQFESSRPLPKTDFGESKKRLLTG